MDLDSRTLAALDWGVVLDALARHARTHRGAQAARLPDACTALADIRARFAAVEEVLALEGTGRGTGERVPVGAVGDIAEDLDRASRGMTLEPEELRRVADTLAALRHLRTWVEERPEPLEALRTLVLPVVVDAELLSVLGRSFDDGSPGGGGTEDIGGLSEREYPELGQLRRKIESLRSRIQRTLDDLVKGGGLGDALMDTFVTQRDGRFVVPIKADRRKGLGIVHGRSQSGETVYVEPAAVVEAHNELDEAVQELRVEVGRILGVLSRMVGRFRDPLLVALDAAREVDLACARAGLGRELRGRVPTLGDEGVVHLVQARHPVLALRGVDVVPNDLRVDGTRPGLVLSGPNTGGKTVALKTLGLAALMVRHGIPVPCGEGSRVDLFVPVVADVGDWQSVEGDLSTFSGHVEVLKAVLKTVGEGAQPEDGAQPALVLLDEVGMGTDPAQGAALARAILEALVEGGARVAATTHFTELKALAAVDDRFEVAAVAIEDGRPTYQLILGTAGESHALAIARRLALSDAVVDRARSLLDSHQREVSDLVAKLEEERGALAARVRAQAEQEAALSDRVRQLEQREARLEERRDELERRVSERFAARMKAREHELKGLIAALQDNPDLRLAGRALSKVRDALEESKVPEPERDSRPPPTELSVGDNVVVRSLGKKGTVHRLLKGDQVSVRIGALTMKVARTNLEGSRGERFAAAATKPPKPKARPPRSRSGSSGGASERLGGVRIDANTCDLRGKRVDEALDEIDRFLAGLVGDGFDTGWILHGHGTGALKQAVRRALPRRQDVKRWRPADVGEGGDAFTVVEVG